MARIIVETDRPADAEPRVVLEERVGSVHLETDIGAAHLVERLGWAIADAEDLETES